MQRLGVFFILFMGPLLALEGQDSFSEKDLESFVVVYMTQKQYQHHVSFDITFLLAKHDVSKERYGEIIRRHLNNQRSTLTRNETAFVQDIEKEREKLEKQKEKTLRKDCAEYAILYETYKAILHNYKTLIAFQHSLKPYFDQYINQKK